MNEKEKVLGCGTGTATGVSPDAADAMKVVSFKEELIRNLRLFKVSSGTADAQLNNNLIEATVSLLQISDIPVSSLEQKVV